MTRRGFRPVTDDEIRDLDRLYARLDSLSERASRPEHTGFNWTRLIMLATIAATILLAWRAADTVFL